MRPITVIVAGCDPGWFAVCQSVLREEKDIVIVGHAEQHDDAMAATVQLKPRIVLCSLRFAATAGYSLFATLRQKSPETLGVLCTDDTVAENQVIAALAHGAFGFLKRNDLPHHLPQAMRVVAAGQAWVPRKMLGSIGDRLSR